MDLTKYYPDIVAKYPAYVTKRELCEICHICPKTAYNLEQQGEIPYTIEQNHLIRSHKIKLTDILAYLYRRECRQEADSPYICAMRTFYDEHLSPYSDLLSVKDIQQITGFSSSAIVRWISTGILKAFQPGKQYTVPKDFMLDFLIPLRNDERLRTIYEVMAPYIVRNEHNWRDYLAFASQFHKHSFDNILLVYAQDEDVSILATRKQWAAIGRNLIPRAKGVAVCVYRNAKLTLDYLFDVSQTTGKEIHPTDWQLSDEMKKALTERLSYAHGFPKQDFPQALYAMASESVAENYNHFLQELKQETKGHLFTEIPAGGFEAQSIQLLTDSISYFIGKKCHLPDEEIQLSDGMATVSHFNTLPLVAHLGTAVTALSKGILLEVERNIKIINRERMAQHEQSEYQSEIQGAGRDDASRSANLQQQRSRSTSGQVRPDGPGIPQRESPGAIYDFENGWQSDGDHAPGTGRGDREDRSPDAANAPAGAASADRGHHGADATPEQSETDGGGNRTPERSPDSPLTEEQPNTEVAPSAAPVGEPSEKDGSFSVPTEQPTRHFTDAEVRRNYEYILTSTNLYPPELHSAVRSVLSEPPLNPDWSDKGRQIAALFTPYGDREYQGDLLYHQPRPSRYDVCTRPFSMDVQQDVGVG